MTIPPDLRPQPNPPTPPPVTGALRGQTDDAIEGRKEAAKQMRAEMISEVMAHPAIAAHVALYDRTLSAVERQAAAFEKIADALSRIAPTPARLQEEAEEAPLRRKEQECRTEFWTSISQLMPVMLEEIQNRMSAMTGDVTDTPGGDDKGPVQ